MKRLISIILCAAMFFTAVLAGTLSASAAEDTDTAKHYSIISSKTITIPDNEVRLYTSGLTADNCTGTVGFVADDETLSAKVVDSIDNYSVMHTSANKEYRYTLTFLGIKETSSRIYSFEKTGGTYEWVRFKIYDFSDESWGFNENGTVTKNFEVPHTYNFTREDKYHSSILLIISGAAVTAVTPDKDGYVEAYLSTNLGDDVEFNTAYRSNVNVSIGGGGSRESLLGLAVGDVNQDGLLNVTDATYIQKYLAEIVDFDSLSKRTADVNHDGIINVLDSTEIQKQLAGLR